MDNVKRASRSGEYIRWRLRVADAYRAQGMVTEGDNFESCSDPSHFFNLQPGDTVPGESVGVVVCSADPAHVSKAICPSCQYRTCPDCAHRESARLLNRYMPMMRKHLENPRPGWEFKHIVLTTNLAYCDQGAQEKIDELYKQARGLFEALLKSHQKGPISVSEVGIVISHEFGANGLKFHLHALYYGPWLRQDDISKEWRKRTGNMVVYIHAIGPGQRHTDLESAVAEVLKYATKFWRREPNGKVVYVKPEAIPIIHKLLAGTRRVRSWGLFYNAAEPEEESTCPDCGAPLALLKPDQWDAWSQTGWNPEELRRVLAHDDSLFNLKLGNKSPPDTVPKWRKEPLL